MTRVWGLSQLGQITTGLGQGEDLHRNAPGLGSWQRQGLGVEGLVQGCCQIAMIECGQLEGITVLGAAGIAVTQPPGGINTQAENLPDYRLGLGQGGSGRRRSHWGR